VAGNLQKRHEAHGSRVQIEGYDVIGVLGRGGMGVVYEGRQISLGRRVAIKFLSPTLAENPEFVARFQREAAALARLTHPNVVTIFERGKSSAGVYFVMEYVEGPGGGGPVDLRAVLKSRRLSEEEVIRLGLQLARALGYAHQMGVVHRDIKPGNVMLDRHGQARIADFGIAMLDSEYAGGHLTGPSQPLGSIDYMAPEQRDDASLVDGRADIYSLGVMLYEMLTGILPRGAWLRPSVVVPTLNRRWDHLIELMLQPLVERRIKDMQRVAEQVEGMFGISGHQSQSAGSESTSHATPASVPAATSRLYCVDCGAIVDTDARFCPVCRLQQWVECPQCHEQQHSGSRFCTSCGAGIHGYRMLQKYSADARKNLDLAMDASQSLPARCQHAHQAGLAALRASKHAAESEDVRTLLRSVNEYQITLLRQAAAEAVSAHRLGEATGFLEQILQVAANDYEAKAQLENIRSCLNQRVVQAQRLLTKGRIQDAISLLEELSRKFPEDALLNGRLAEYTAQRETQIVVCRRIPELKEKKRWYAIRRELIELRKAGIRISGLAEIGSIVRSRFAAIVDDLNAARSAFAERRIIEARQRAEKVIYHISDHPVALHILEAIQGAELQAEELSRRLRNSLTAGEVFSGAAAIRSSDRLVRSMLPADLQRQIRQSCQRADNYVRLLRWLVLGIPAVPLAVWIQGPLLRGFEELLPENETVGAAWWAVPVTQVCTQSMFIATTVPMLAALRLFVRRPVSPASVTTWVIIAVEGMATFQFCQLVLPEVIEQAGFVSCLARMGIGAAAGGIFGLASGDLADPARGRCLRGLTSGVLAVGLFECAGLSVPEYTRFVVPGLWLAGWLLMAGRLRSPAGIPILFCSSVLAGVLAAGLERQDVTWTERQIDVLGTVMLALAATAVSKTHRLWRALLAGCFVWTVTQLSSDMNQTIMMLSIWLILNMALVSERYRDFDFRLLLRDRQRARRILAAHKAAGAGN